MATSTLDVGSVISATIVLQPKAAATRNFGSALILGASSVIDVSERKRYYSGSTALTQVANDFGTSAPEYLAASVYLSQSPQPAGVYIGRFAQTATAAVLHGGLLSTSAQAIANFTAITSGTLNITVDGVAKTLSAINLSAQTNLNGVAAVVQTALAGAATVTWNSVYQRFDVVSATTGTSSSVTYATGTVATVMGLVSGTALAPVNGIAAESAVQCAQTFLNYMDWYGLTFAATLATSDHLAVAALIEGAGGRIYGVSSQDSGILSSAVTTDVCSQLSALGYNRTFVQYSSSNAYSSASLLGRAFTVDFNGSKTTLTLKFKGEPGIAAENLTATQAAAAAAKNCNVYVNYNNGTAIVQEGVMCSGQFFDKIHGMDWFQNDVQTAVWNLFYTSTTKIPQTDAGVGLILATIEARCDQGVRNGLFAPGVWNASGFGNLNQGDTLTKGYYAYALPMALQSVADRGARKAPVIQVALKLAGAIHHSDILLNVND